MASSAPGVSGNVTLTVNGNTASVPDSMVLLTALRDSLGLTGPKLGCGEGACGACVVLVDGEPVTSCQRAAASVAGREVTTIEGLQPGGRAPGHRRRRGCARFSRRSPMNAPLSAATARRG